MDISKNDYRIIFTNDSIKEMDEIYWYISNKLYAPNAAKKLMNQTEKEIYRLKQIPEIGRVIKRIPELNLEYRRIIIKNFVVIYNIDINEKTVYIAHMFYGRSNYLNSL